MRPRGQEDDDHGFRLERFARMDETMGWEGSGMTSLKEIQVNFEGFAQADPLWAICTDSQKRGRRWNREQFFATGELEISRVMQYVQALVLSPRKADSALDFGCGVGRLTGALSQYFDSCCGVDISPTMIQLAKDFHGHNPRCS